jgi:catechol-2,3-dioxygenase
MTPASGRSAARDPAQYGGPRPIAGSGRPGLTAANWPARAILCLGTGVPPGPAALAPVRRGRIIVAATETRTYAIQSLGHVVLRVRNIERSEPFYRDVLGLQVRERHPGRAIFFTCGQQHHDLAIFQIGDDAPPPEDKRVGMYHVALKLPDFDQLKALYKHARASGANIVGMNWHQGSKSVYVKDPDGLEIEVYCESAEKGTEAELRRELEA